MSLTGQLGIRANSKGRKENKAHFRPCTALVTYEVSLITTFLSSCLLSTKWLS